ncbi:hypothetical protein OJ253_2691 [Cryptosporidium canis]|uniref:K Homology domain-containing protein n=1 Tax=Cryptosporidium canis TaxID=195482 RepID=A0A9D5HWI2_9CRYT|nr:hypothetical protein OJ253_2691 [Cryptosporidium canis]
MWHPTFTGHSEGLEAMSSNQVAKAGPADKRQKGKLRSGPTNSANQRRVGTRFSNNPNLQAQPHLSNSSSSIMGVSMGPMQIPGSSQNSMGIGGINSSSLNSMSIPPGVAAQQIPQPSPGQPTSYRHTKKIPIDRSKFHPSISNLAGAIIGVSGSNQKWMEQESGAQVQILGTTGNDPDGLHVLVRYNEPRELEIVEAIIDEIGRATFEGGGGFISHILPNRKPVSPTLTSLQNNINVSGTLQDHSTGIEKHMMGNGMMIGGAPSLPPSYSSQHHFNSMPGNVGMGFIQRGGMITPVSIDWPKTPPTSPVEFEWLLHLVLHSALSQLGPMVSHGVPMIHIPMLYDSFTSFRFEHDATSFFQSYIIQNGLLGLVHALPHIFIEGPHTIVDSSNIPKLSPIFKVDSSSGVTPLLLPAQSITVSFADFKLAAEAYWKMGALPPAFTGFGPQFPQSINGVTPNPGVTGAGLTGGIPDHLYTTGNIISQNQHPRLYQEKDNLGQNIDNETNGGTSPVGTLGKFKDQTAQDAINTKPSQSAKGSLFSSSDDDTHSMDKTSTISGTAGIGFSSVSHSASTTTSAGASPNIGKDNIPRTSLMIVLQGVHFLLRRWISKRLAPHYIPKSSLDFLPLDVLESEFAQFYEVPLNIEILGWTNLLHFVEAFPDVWTVENVGPDEFTLIPLPYPDFSMIAKTRGIKQLENGRSPELKPESNAFAMSSQNSSISNIKGGIAPDNVQTILKQTKDFVAEAIASGYPANSIEINSINDIIHGVTIGMYILDNNISSSLYELVTKVTNMLPKYSPNSISNANIGLPSKSVGGVSKSRFDSVCKGPNGVGSLSGGLSNGITPGGFQQPHLMQPQTPAFASGHLSAMNEASTMGQGAHHLPSAAPISTSRFSNANTNNEIRYDIGAIQSVSAHNQHNIHNANQTNAQVANNSLSTGRSVINGQSKRVFSNQCIGTGSNNGNAATSKGHKQLTAGQEQRSYPIYDQKNNNTSEFVNIQQNSSALTGQNTFGLQGDSGNNVHSYYHPPMDGNPHFNPYNGAVPGMNNGASGSCHYDYQSFGVQPANPTFSQPSQNHNINGAHFSKSIGVLPSQSFGGNNNNGSVMLSLSNSTGLPSTRSSWDRKSKTKNN